MTLITCVKCHFPWSSGTHFGFDYVCRGPLTVLFILATA